MLNLFQCFTELRWRVAQKSYKTISEGRKKNQFKLVAIKLVLIVTYSYIVKLKEVSC